MDCSCAINCGFIVIFVTAKIKRVTVGYSRCCGKQPSLLIQIYIVYWLLYTVGSNNEQLHAIFLLPCEMEDRKFDVNLKTLEIAFNRTCQLACSYCNPAFSSTWVKDIRTNGGYQGVKSDARGHFIDDAPYAEPAQGDYGAVGQSGILQVGNVVVLEVPCACSHDETRINRSRPRCRDVRDKIAAGDS